MEPRRGPAQEVTAAEEQPASRLGARLFAACVLLVGVAIVQSPGMLVSDTKFDLAVNPAAFLGRALYLWDADGALGQLQNQAYGYLWPMGPFFLLGVSLDVPGWVVQRLWVALVMCVALTGAAKVARALGVRSDLACLVAGFAYALSPRMVTTLGPISIEAWPSALAPWVLLPLVVGSIRGSARRAAAQSAVAVALVGGVNAAATFAVLPLGVLWILTRSPGPRRRALLVWWPAFTALGTVWWLVPLFLMGAYSPPFLDYIESASVTTFPTTLFDALRGTSHWVPYVDSTWRAGNDLLRSFYLAVNSGVLMLLGLVGLMLSRNQHRLFLALGLLLGIAMVTMGHTGSVAGWGAGQLQDLMDGVLAPLRNVHKFDPIVRLPLVVGLAFVVDRSVAAFRSQAGDRSHHAVLSRVNHSVLVATAVAAIVGAALPVLHTRLTPGGGTERIPEYWTQAAGWLADEAGEGAALVLPGSSFGNYVWGFPRDEPMQVLATTPWAVRNAVPLTPPGNIRMLDAIEERMAQGLPSAGLADYLRRAGVTHLVVRNDLVPSPDVPSTVLVHQAVEGSPGLRRVATFGPEVGGEAHLPGDDGRIVVNGGWQNEYPAVEVYEVEGSTGAAVRTSAVPVVVGGPEDLLDLTDLGILDEHPTVLAPDLDGNPDPDQALILTDGLRLRERYFGRVHDGSSATLSASDPRRLTNPTSDYLPEHFESWRTEAVFGGGVELVTASSSMADAAAAGGVEPGQLPMAALDGRPETAWVADSGADGPAWWSVELEEPMEIGSVTIRAGPHQREEVQVSTSASTSEVVDVPAGLTRTIEIEDPAAEWLRVEDASRRPGHQLSLAEVEIDGLSAERLLQLPVLPEDWGNPDAVVLRALDDARTGCAVVDAAVRCVGGRGVVGEEPLGFARLVTLADPQTFHPALRVRPRPGSVLVEELTEESLVGVAATSTGTADVRASALAAIDGDPGTTWTAELDDLRPVLSLNWIGERRITGLRVSVARDTAARRPTDVTLVWPGGRRTVMLDRDGTTRFKAINTDRLTLQIEDAEPAVSLDFAGIASPVPVGISELRLGGLPLLPITLSSVPRRFSCGTGPTLTLGDRKLETSVEASPLLLATGGVVEAEICGVDKVALTAGANRVALESSPLFTPDSLVLSESVVPPPAPWPLPFEMTDPVSSEIDLGQQSDAGDLVVVRRNANPGWSAEQAGNSLDPVTIDGWQQGWRLEESETPVDLSYEPNRAYIMAILAGLAGLVALLVISLVPERRWSGAALEPTTGRAAGPPVLGVAAVLAGGLLGGWVGAACGAAGFALARWLTARRSPVAVWLTPAAVAPAALVYALRPWGSDAGSAGTLSWPHYLVLVACCGVLGALAAEPAVRRPRFFRRIPGISTVR